ncbi:hypothetical protein LTR04_000935 [Oleoguttula sp. CCFEE 6159]|nr:hypothetical protein LTR04_000935 [Oleoguttula sp. CCFEE 6159]
MSRVERFSPLREGDLSLGEPPGVTASPDAEPEIDQDRRDTIKGPQSIAALEAAAANQQAFERNAALPSTSTPPYTRTPPGTAQAARHPHTPASLGLHIHTDLSPSTSGNSSPTPRPPLSRNVSNTPLITETPVETMPHHSVSQPIYIQGQMLRTVSSTSMDSQDSSILLSPALASLTHLTPLPSPLMAGDSPGPRKRLRAHSKSASLGSLGSSGGRQEFNGSQQENNVPFSSPNSPYRLKKGYSNLKPAAMEAHGANVQAQQDHNTASHGSNRSISEFVPEALHNVRPRHVSALSHTLSESKSLPQMHREEYLAAQRGLIKAPSTTDPAKTLPSPPPSSIGLGDSEEGDDESRIDVEPSIECLAVRYGASKKRKLFYAVRLLGQGTFSKVVLATSTPPSTTPTTTTGSIDEAALPAHSLVAIKIVEHGPAGGADEERVELSLKREVAMLREVKGHPSLTNLKAFDCTDERALLVLEYCPGGDLFDMASERRDVLTPEVVQRMFAELVGAVRFLHTRWIVHRDIKLENVLVNLPPSTLPLLPTPSTRPHPLITLTDLGLSRHIPAPPASPLLTTRCGSEDYAAPEILLGQPYDGRATDAWALGVLLYALVEGRLPFDPLPGARSGRGRAVHRIARCEWVWCRFGDEEGEWVEGPEAAEWAGARVVVEGLLKKVRMGRRKLEDVEQDAWVRAGVRVAGGLVRAATDADDAEDMDADAGVDVDVDVDLGDGDGEDVDVDVDVKAQAGAER